MVVFFNFCFVFSLSKLQLKTGDLDPRLFSRLRHLQKLDLSDNLLDKFPNSLTLPDLRVLNCNNNKLEDVTALKQFPLLEELTYENNVYLTVSYPLLPLNREENKQHLCKVLIYCSWAASARAFERAASHCVTFNHFVPLFLNLQK